MTETLNTETVDLDSYVVRKKKGKVYIGDLVRAIRVNTPNGHGFFYRKDGTYQMSHAGTANVGEYESVNTTFPEYTSELQTERNNLIGMIGAAVDEEISILEGAYNV